MSEQDPANDPADSFDFSQLNTGAEKPSARRRRPEGRPVAGRGTIFDLIGGFKGILLLVVAVVLYFAYSAWQDSLERNKQRRMQEMRQAEQEDPVEPWFGQ